MQYQPLSFFRYDPNHEIMTASYDSCRSAVETSSEMQTQKRCSVSVYEESGHVFCEFVEAMVNVRDCATKQTNSVGGFFWELVSVILIHCGQQIYLDHHRVVGFVACFSCILFLLETRTCSQTVGVSYSVHLSDTNDEGVI